MVIGAGSAGFSAAITAAEAGADVTLVGDGTIGGTCVNIGCVPSKTMIRAVEPLYQAGHAARFEGIASSSKVLDWRAVVAQKQQLVDDLRQTKYIDVLPFHPGVNHFTVRKSKRNYQSIRVTRTLYNKTAAYIGYYNFQGFIAVFIIEPIGGTGCGVPVQL